MNEGHIYDSSVLYTRCWPPWLVGGRCENGYFSKWQTPAMCWSKAGPLCGGYVRPYRPPHRGGSVEPRLARLPPLHRAPQSTHNVPPENSLPRELVVIFFSVPSKICEYITGERGKKKVMAITGKFLVSFLLNCGSLKSLQVIFV